MNRPFAERKVLKQLGAHSFRELNKEQIINFVSSIPDMSKEVALKCLEQVPYYLDSSKQVVTAYYDLCKDMLNNDNLANQEIEAHRIIIDACKERIDSVKSIPDNEYHELINIMKVEATTIENIVNKHLTLKEKVLHGAEVLTGVVIATGATLLGVKQFKK